MIVMSKVLRGYVSGFETKAAFCEKIGISYPTFLSYWNNQVSVSNDFIEKVTEELGLDFEKAFESVEDKDGK